MGPRCSLWHRQEPAPATKFPLLNAHHIALLGWDVGLILPHWLQRPPAAWAVYRSPHLAPDGSRMLHRVRQYQAEALSPPGTRVGFPPAEDASVWELPLSTSLPDFYKQGHSSALCPLKSGTGFPPISVASEAKCLLYSPPLLLSQQTTFILPSTRLFQGSMGRQDDELVPVVTVALSITADIPGGHMSPKDSPSLGNSTKRLKLSFAMKPPQSPSPVLWAGRSWTCKDLSGTQEVPRVTSTGATNTEQSAGLQPSLLLLWGYFHLPFHRLISSQRAIWINTSSCE